MDNFGFSISGHEFCGSGHRTVRGVSLPGGFDMINWRQLESFDDDGEGTSSFCKPDLVVIQLDRKKSDGGLSIESSSIVNDNVQVRFNAFRASLLSYRVYCFSVKEAGIKKGE